MVAANGMLAGGPLYDTSYQGTIGLYNTAAAINPSTTARKPL